uniref:G-protein coupled receptors family 1 profile domain-containing protein n=1 Tax=Panagrolaimus sp. JU765 TaxID=591449 RepID=A0AC34QHR6_9BILA
MKPLQHRAFAAEKLVIHDVFVFAGLELLGTLAVTGNLCLIVVLLRNKYLNRASFILMLSLAFADVFHGICTTCYFYPPIVLRETVPEFGVRIFNIIDWTAWSITLTHMSAICLDRLVAIMLYGKYNQIVTLKRVRLFSMGCWSTFICVNFMYYIFNFCCLIRPLKSSHYYTFGYDENKLNTESFLGDTNVYFYTYTPTEIVTLIILSVSNPVTLVQLYRRHKRKIALRQASTMLLEMSMRMGSKAVTNDVRELASKRANRQQQRILFQISVVAVIFYLYMTTYYLVYYIFETENKWVMLFNSFFYSTTHMINPVIYFSLNKEMRAQLVQAMADFLAFICCTSSKARTEYGSMIKPSAERKTSNKMENSFTATETSPLFSSAVLSNKHGAMTVTFPRISPPSLLSPFDDQGSSDSKDPDSPENQPLMTIDDVEYTEINEEKEKTVLNGFIKTLTKVSSVLSNQKENGKVYEFKKFQSRSFDFSQTGNDLRNMRTSNTLECFTVGNAEFDSQDAKIDGLGFLSPISQTKSPESAYSYSDNNSSNSEQYNRLTHSCTWQKWSKLKNDNNTHQNTYESLTLLLDDNSLEDADDNDVIYL